MKVLTHFMQTIFKGIDDKIRIRFLKDKSGIIITALVNDVSNDDAKCDVKKMEQMAAKSSLSLFKASDGEVESALIVITIKQFKRLAKNAKLFYGRTAILQELTSDKRFDFEESKNGVTVDLGCILSDFELFKMMHKVKMERYTYTGGWASYATSKMAKVLTELSERNVTNEEGINLVLDFAEKNPGSNTEELLRDNAHYFTESFQARIREWQLRVEQAKSQTPEANASWFGVLKFN